MSTLRALAAALEAPRNALEEWFWTRSEYVRLYNKEQVDSRMGGGVNDYEFAEADRAHCASNDVMKREILRDARVSHPGLTEELIREIFS